MRVGMFGCVYRQGEAWRAELIVAQVVIAQCTLSNDHPRVTAGPLVCTPAQPSAPLAPRLLEGVSQPVTSVPCAWHGKMPQTLAVIMLPAQHSRRYPAQPLTQNVDAVIQCVTKAALVTELEHQAYLTTDS